MENILDFCIDTDGSDNTLDNSNTSGQRQPRHVPLHILGLCDDDNSDQEKVAEMRRMDAKARGNLGNSKRYFLDGDQRRKFGHLKPGSFPSRALREALGLRDYQLPAYVYRLRILGYPPAWLNSVEGGSATEDSSAQNRQRRDRRDWPLVDTSKMVVWPGFNTPLPYDREAEMVEESGYYNCPPFHRDQDVSHMIRTLKRHGHTAHHRRSPKDSESSGVVLDDSQTSQEVPGDDVKTENQSESLIRPPGEDDMIKDGATKDSLAEHAEDATSGDVEDAKDEPNCGEEMANSAMNGHLMASPKPTKVLSEVHGTPIVELHSPYQSLPDRTKWAAMGLSDHIFFDNLPNYTGTWDTVNSVLKRARSQTK